jgi:hypothetical protein
MKHLNKVKKHPDAQHPAADPLWDSEVVQYILTPRPKKYDDGKRKRGSKESNQRYYRKRTKTQSEQGDMKKVQFEAGEITAEEYTKVLVGHRRREFLAEVRLKGRLEQQVSTDNEQRIQQHLEQRLSELRSANTLSPDDIRSLESVRDELEKCEASLHSHRRQLSTQSAKVVQFFASASFLDSNDEYLPFHGFEWPNVPSIEAYYEFAAFLLPPAQFNDQIRSGHSKRMMKRTLHEYLKAEKVGLPPEHAVYMDETMGVFKASCDLLEAEERKASAMGGAEALRWIDKQDELWTARKKLFLSKCNFYGAPAIVLQKLIDEIADMHREMKEIEKSAEVARRNAQRATNV